MPRKRAKKTGMKRKIDMAGVETGYVSVPDGEYTAEINKVSLEVGESSGKEYYRWTFKITGPVKMGATVRTNTSLQPQALFNLKSLLMAVGYDVPEAVMEFDPEDILEEKLGIEVINERRENKDYPQVVRFMDVEEVSGITGAQTRADEEEDEEAEIQVGSKVAFKDEDGKKIRGVVTAVDEEELTVDVKGEEWGLDYDEVTLVS